jgi:hypothetical protein
MADAAEVVGMTMHSDPFQTATHYAEGFLSAAHDGGSRFAAGWAGARYVGYPLIVRPVVAVIIACDLRRRGLVAGFDLHSLRDQQHD